MSQQFSNEIGLTVPDAIGSVLRQFLLTLDQYQQMSEVMNREMERGLKKATHDEAIIKMFPSYVRDLPCGDEEGQFLALDLGGTNFRVLLITIHNGRVIQKDKIYEISEALRTGPGENLFDFIAGCIQHFREEHNLNGSHSLGFTFSFPCAQFGLREARLVTWTKGFCCPGVEGQNVADLLDEALKKREQNVRCLAVLNDTVGTLMSCALKEPHCMVGAIFGTGTNACYVEKLDRVELWDLERDDPQQVIINTEWGAFGSDGSIDFLRTEFDRQLDAASINPGRQIFEKMIAGMYLGEILRFVLVKLIHDGALFGGRLETAMGTPGKLYTKHVSEIERDWLAEQNAPSDAKRFGFTRQVLHELGYDKVSDDDARIVAAAAHCIAHRAAYLSAAALVTLVRRIDNRRGPITIGVDGSLFKYHPSFAQSIEVCMRALLDADLRFQLVESTDGSGKGAAVVAAVAEAIARGRDRGPHSVTRLNALDKSSGVKHAEQH